jgi:hypothetical protein
MPDTLSREAAIDKLFALMDGDVVPEALVGDVLDRYARAHIDALTAAVEGVIFDLPIGDDVTYSRGYSAGVAASRAAVLAILRGEQ